MAENYDQLSKLGEKQSYLLGQYLAQKGWVFDSVYSGALTRHRQTREQTARAYAESGLHWPEQIEIPDFDEHHGPAVTAQAVPRLVQEDPAFKAYVDEIDERKLSPGRRQMKLYRKITQMWASGELEVEDQHHEPWASFRARVGQAFQAVIDQNRKGKTIAIFTSGGPVAASVGYALKLNPLQVLELSWAVQNTGYAEFLFSEEGISMQRFNSLAHLADQKMWTFV